jgi:hypothetical protein
MQIPTFHDGGFEGFKRGSDKQVQLYLTTGERESFVLMLEGVEVLTLTDIREGNIIFDLVIRSGHELTVSDIEYVYGIRNTPTDAGRLLKAAVDKGLQLLEINPSYGAEGMVLFRTWKLQPQSD